MNRFFRVVGFMDLLLTFGAFVLAIVAAFTPGELRIVILAAVLTVVLGLNCFALFTLADESDDLRKAIKKKGNSNRFAETPDGKDFRPPAGEAW